MDVFHRRISLDEAATIVQAAHSRQLLDGASSAIFHHLGLMRARVAALQAAFPDRTLHAVAIKANPVVEILRELVQAGAGLEAASIEEVQLALAAGCPGERIVFDSPAKTVDEIGQALRWGVLLNADNFDELNRIAAARQNVRVDVAGGPARQCHGRRRHDRADERLASRTPSSAFLCCPTGKKIVAAFAEHDWLSGLHVHVGSQGCGLALLVEAAERIAGLRREIMAETGSERLARRYRWRAVDGLSHRRHGTDAR